MENISFNLYDQEHNIRIGTLRRRGNVNVETISLDFDPENNKGLDWGVPEDFDFYYLDIPVDAAKELVIKLCEALGPVEMRDMPDEVKDIII